jgi:hypothetical protein
LKSMRLTCTTGIVSKKAKYVSKNKHWGRDSAIHGSYRSDGSIPR